MLKKHTFFSLQRLVAVLFLFVMALSGCDSTSTPVSSSLLTLTPTPTPPAPTLTPPSPPPQPTNTPAPPDVTVTWTPAVSDSVEVGQEIAFVVETETQNVQFQWSAINGTLSPSEGSAVIYTAPGIEGVDIVTLEASNEGGTITEHISFNVVAPPTDTSPPTPIPIPTPTVPNAVVGDSDLHLRSGPGIVYVVITTLSPGQVLTVTGRNDDATWLQVTTDQAQEGWVAADFVTLNLPAEEISTAPPPPTPTPSPEQITAVSPSPPPTLLPGQTPAVSPSSTPTLLPGQTPTVPSPTPTLLPGQTPTVPPPTPTLPSEQTPTVPPPTPTSPTEPSPTVPLPPSPTPPPVDLMGKVCQIKSGWDTNTIFLRQTEFNALGLPIGTKVTVAVLDAGTSIEEVTLSLDSRLEICSVRLAKSLREALGVNTDTAVESVRDRPDRQFGIIPTSPPSNEEAIDFQGKVCMIKSGQDTNTIFLRQPEYNAFGIPAGTTVIVTVLDTGKTVKNVTLGLDSSLATCSMRLAKSLRGALEVADDTDIDSPGDRPDRQFSIRLSQP